MTAAITPANREALCALSRLFYFSWSNGGRHAEVIARLLLGLYDGKRFPFDLTNLRLLEDALLKDAMTLIQFDARPVMEIHEWLNQIYEHTDFGTRIEHLAHEWRIRGRSLKAWQPGLREFYPRVLFHEQEGGAA